MEDIKSSIKEAKRIYGLDILRSIAIITVLIPHSGRFLPKEIDNYIQYYAIDGVSIFFVLSGFLIGTILIKTINKANFEFPILWNFWTRRWLRTLPAYFSVVFFLLFFAWINGSLPVKKTVIEALTFTQSLLFDKANFYTESWSLAVEEWFYFLIPLSLFICLIIVKRTKAVFLSTVLLIILACTIARIYLTLQINVSDISTWDNAIRKPALLRLDSIMYGVLGAYINYYQYKIWQKKQALFFIGIMLFLLMEVLRSNLMMYVVLSLESIATLLLLPLLNSIRSGKGVIFKFFTFTSIISYSLYLLNSTPYNNIVYPYIKKISGSETVAFIFFYVWAFGGAYVLYKVIEQPFMNLRDKFYKQPQYLHPKSV